MSSGQTRVAVTKRSKKMRHHAKRPIHKSPPTVPLIKEGDQVNNEVPSSEATDDVPDRARNRTLSWPTGEFLRVASDPEAVAVVWSTELSLSALLAAVRERAQFSSGDLALVVSRTNSGDELEFSEIPVPEILHVAEADDPKLTSVQVPFEDFWLSWSRDSSDERGNSVGNVGLSEAAITYVRQEMRHLDPLYIERTASPLLRADLTVKLAELRRLKFL
jgi:hypothetical protein